VRPLRHCWFLTGPTASGKSAVGHLLAQRLGGEIIAMDSMSLYRGMDIGTAKPDEAARREVPYHLVDVLEPSEEYSLAQYVSAAWAAANDILGRGRTPIFVGGTPLYLKALLRGIFQGPPADWELRERLRREAAEQGPAYLHERLLAVDPAAAQKLKRGDARRLIRALEVCEKTGTPISELQRQFDQPVPREECRVFVLDWPREALYRRIDERVEAMFAAGLVNEVRRLLARGPLSRTAAQAVGYREVIEHLEGREDQHATIELVKRHSRQLAKRQLTWFRSLSECRWISMKADTPSEQVVQRIIEEGALVGSRAEF